MKFLEKAELAKLSEQERNRYEYSLKVYRDERLVQYSREVEKKEFEQARKDLARARSEVDHARNELVQARTEVDQVRNEVVQARSEVDQARNEVVEAQEKVNQAREELNQNRENLNRIEQEKQKMLQDSNELAFKTAIEIAKNAYKEGLSISIIAKMTGLSEDEILKQI